MDIKVKGNQTIGGEITPSGSKNSAVAIIPATILFKGKVILHNIPEITDVLRLVGILRKLGSKISWDKNKETMVIDNSIVDMKNLDHDDLGNMRGTSLLWGPMLARFGEVDFDQLPGGCTLGARPLNPHYQALSDLGVTIIKEENGVKMKADNVHSDEILLSEMSPTVTENIIMFATSLKGLTVIKGAASEPQVQDLCLMLQKAGVDIKGIGTSVIRINAAGAELYDVEHKLFSDHYEIATYLALAGATKGEITVNEVNKDLFEPIDKIFRKFDLKINYSDNKAHLDASEGARIVQTNSLGNLIIKAQPWPSLPVDTLPLFIPLALSTSRGQVLFHNWMYEAGLFWTSELTKLGANIIMADPHRVIVITGNKLNGATLEAPYIIRAVVAMLMTSMISNGESTILNADALFRGHPNFSKKLKELGVVIDIIED